MSKEITELSKNAAGRLFLFTSTCRIWVFTVDTMLPDFDAYSQDIMKEIPPSSFIVFVLNCTKGLYTGENELLEVLYPYGRCWIYSTGVFNNSYVSFTEI